MILCQQVFLLLESELINFANDYWAALKQRETPAKNSLSF